MMFELPLFNAIGKDLEQSQSVWLLEVRLRKGVFHVDVELRIETFCAMLTCRIFNVSSRRQNQHSFLAEYN